MYNVISFVCFEVIIYLFFRGLPTLGLARASGVQWPYVAIVISQFWRMIGFLFFLLLKSVNQQIIKVATQPLFCTPSCKNPPARCIKGIPGVR